MHRVAEHVAAHRHLFRRQQYLTDVEQQQKKVPAVALRLIVCGDEFAGKTTLSSSLVEVCSKRALVRQKGKDISKCLCIVRSADGTHGAEVHKIEEDGIRISLWDMAGQREFEAFNGYMSQDSSSEDSCPALVLFVWSPVASENEGDGDNKSREAFQKSLWHWLKLVASSTRRSNVARKAIVAITRKDQRRHVENLVGEEIEDLEKTFKGIVEIAEAVQVDARSSSSVKPLAACIFEAAKEVLCGVKTYSVCGMVSRHISSSSSRKVLFRGRPIIEWGDFEKYIEEVFKISSRDVQKAIASSVHDSGDLIHLGTMLILDIQWFCQEMAVKLINFPDFLPPNAQVPVKGFAPIRFVEKMLEDQTKKKVPGAQLVKLMEAMHLSCKDPKDPQRMFIPSTLLTSSSKNRWGRPLKKWRGRIDGPAAYSGRRLECHPKDLTFFSLGLFETLQVLFLKAFGENDEIDTDLELDRDVMSICIRDMEIILECGHDADGEPVIIDVMARVPDALDARKTLITYVENKIVRTIIQVCRELVGNQGVRPVEGVIHPDALVDPVSLRERDGRCVPTQDLKQQLRRQLEETMRQQQRLVYERTGNRLQPFVDLLGVQVVEGALLLYKQSVISADEKASQAIGVVCTQNEEDVTSVGHSSVAASSAVLVGGCAAGSTISTTSPAHHSTQHDDSVEGITFAQVAETSTNVFEEEDALHHPFSYDLTDHEDLKESLPDENRQTLPAAARLTRGMVSSIQRYFHKLDKTDTKLGEIKATVESSHEGIQVTLDAMLGEVSQIQNRALPKIVKVVEHTLYFAGRREEGKLPRLVCLTTGGKNMGTRRRMVTSVFKGLESVHIELFCEHRERPHRVEAQKGLWVTTIKDGSLKKALPWINDLLMLLTMVAKVGAHVLAGAGSVIGGIPDLANLIAYGSNIPGRLDNKGFQRADEALAGWQEWLSSVLRDHGGTSEPNIAHHFKLRRAIYCDTSHVAWLCPKHFPSAHSNNGRRSSCLIKPHPLVSS